MLPSKITGISDQRSQTSQEDSILLYAPTYDPQIDYLIQQK